MSQVPLISVVLPLYNASLYIEEAVRSILQQSLGDLELIVIDDGSKDNSYDVVASISDARIRLYRQENAGMAETLNRGISYARGKYIARQDADDIALPTRFEKQVAFLEAHPKAGLIGTHARIIDQEGRDTLRAHSHPSDSDTLKFFLLFDNPFVHSSVMFRREVTNKYGVYNVNIHPLIQDFEYWFRISKTYSIHNLPEVLQEYRELQSGISKTTANFNQVVLDQSMSNISSLHSISNNEAEALASLYHGSSTSGAASLTFSDLDTLLSKLADTCAVSRQAKKYIELQLQRRLCNVFINSTQSSELKKLYFRYKRKQVFAALSKIPV